MKPFSLLERVLYASKKIIPRRLFAALQPPYHYLLSFLGALIYRFPSRNITVIAVTGTKGKTTTVELLRAIFKEAGYGVASSSTLQFTIHEETKRNLYKMTLPGRFFLQKFLRRAVDTGCTHAIIELTSEGARQFRHKFVSLDALVFTNITPEHIESHGSFENYLTAKLSLARAIARSGKPNAAIIANTDDPHGKDFLAVGAQKTIPFSLANAEPYKTSPEGSTFTFHGKKIHTHLPGIFNITNMLGAATCAEAFGIPQNTIVTALEKIPVISGRMEEIRAGQPFSVIVDYAHTSESLTAVYRVFEKQRKICVLGNAGGGRDKWKRPQMGAIAKKYCETIILTDEDPYDEDPEAIVADIKNGIGDHPHTEIILDRQKAIAHALSLAKEDDAVLITGKGTDPFICGKNNLKTPWSDAEVTRGELARLGYTKTTK